MPSDLDIYRSANVLIENYGGADALNIAARRAIGFEGQGEATAAAVWVRIAMAVEEIQRQERRADEAQQ